MALKRYRPRKGNEDGPTMEEHPNGEFALYIDINTPETEDFIEGVIIEAAHQRERWGTDHDKGKTPADWFWLVGYVAGKCLAAVIAGHIHKAKHHAITTAAVLLNWHLHFTGAHTKMQPGSDKAIAKAEQ